MKKIIYFLAFLPLLASAQQQVLTTIAKSNAYVYTPAGYSASQKYPVLIAVPGVGETGTNPALLNTYLPCRFITSGVLAPKMIVVCAQYPVANSWPSLSWLKQIYDSVIRRWAVDTTRVYLTGYSAGGTVSDAFITTPAYTNLIAAVVSMSSPPMNSGATDAPLYKPYAADGGHFWAITGSNDNGNGLSLEVAAMNAQVPGSAIYTEIAGMGHCCWDQFYNPAYKLNGLSIYDWMLQYNQPLATAGSAPTKPVANRRIYLSAGDPRYPQVYITNVATALAPSPGDTLVIPTGVNSVNLAGFSGTAQKPIVLVPADSGWIGGYPNYAFIINNGRYFKATGFHINGKDTSALGFCVGGGSSNYEVAFNEVKHVTAQGFVLKQDPDSTNPTMNFPNTISGLSVHDDLAHNVGAEGFYIGYTNDVTKPLAAPIVSIKAYNLRTDSTGWDGIQFSDAQQISLHDIVVNHYGLRNTVQQQNGIIIGGATTLVDSAYNLSVSNGTGAGILVLGRGRIQLRSVKLQNTAQTAGQSAIYTSDMGDFGYGLAAQLLDFSGISVSGANAYALNVNNTNGTQLKGVVTNFIYTGTGQGVSDPVDLVSACPVCPVCPAPRTVTGISATVNGVTYPVPLTWLKITYSDGSSQ